MLSDRVSRTPRAQSLGKPRQERVPARSGGSKPHERAAVLLEELEGLVPALERDELVLAQAALSRVSGAVLVRGLSLVLDGARKPEAAAPLRLSLEEAAALLGRSPSWLYHSWKRIGLGHRDGGRIAFFEDEVARYLGALRR